MFVYIVHEYELNILKIPHLLLMNMNIKKLANTFAYEHQNNMKTMSNTLLSTSTLKILTVLFVTPASETHTINTLVTSTSCRVYSRYRNNKYLPMLTS